MRMNKQLRKDLKRFFEILDTRETKDSGATFSPVYISSCRVMLTKELAQILPRIRAAAFNTPIPEMSKEQKKYYGIKEPVDV